MAAPEEKEREGREKREIDRERERGTKSSEVYQLAKLAFPGMDR